MHIWHFFFSPSYSTHMIFERWVLHLHLSLRDKLYFVARDQHIQHSSWQPHAGQGDWKPFQLSVLSQWVSRDIESIAQRNSTSRYTFHSEPTMGGILFLVSYVIFLICLMLLWSNTPLLDANQLWITSAYSALVLLSEEFINNLYEII